MGPADGPARPIRTSLMVAAAALLLSLLTHLLGLDIVFKDVRLPETPPAAPEAAPLATTFEDLAETQTEPVAPQETQQPETPERAQEVPPTSEALVASDRPQDTLSPDAGGRTEAEPTPPEPAAQAPEPTPPEPVQSEPAQAEPQPTPQTPIAQAPVTPTAPVAEPPVTAPQVTEPLPQTAALPPQPESLTPVVPVPQTAEPAPEPEPPLAEAEPAETGSALAVTSSLRPRAPDRARRAQAAQPSDPADLLRPPDEPIESPLAAYQRNRDSASDWQGAQGSGSGSGSGGTGNSDRTNYAGRVLVHLNKAPAVAVSGQGSARVFFEIRSDGSLAWVSIVDSSGSIEIESAAKAQVRAAAPFPPPPDGKSHKMTFVYRSD